MVTPRLKGNGRDGIQGSPACCTYLQLLGKNSRLVLLTMTLAPSISTILEMNRQKRTNRRHLLHTNRNRPIVDPHMRCVLEGYRSQADGRTSTPEAARSDAWFRVCRSTKTQYIITSYPRNRSTPEKHT